jgi:ribosomal protein L24E
MRRTPRDIEWVKLYKEKLELDSGKEKEKEV